MAICRYTTQWSVGTLNKGNAAGKEYVLRQTYDGRYIQWHPTGSSWHINQNLIGRLARVH